MIFCYHDIQLLGLLYEFSKVRRQTPKKFRSICTAHGRNRQAGLTFISRPLFLSVLNFIMGKRFLLRKIELD
jgi:hypothetical protein